MPGSPSNNNTIVRGFLGIDIGTQGLTVLVCDEQDLSLVLATGEGTYGFCNTQQQLEEGWYEQQTTDWLQALQTAMKQIHQQFLTKQPQQQQLQVVAIGIAGQMHGQVLMDETQQVLEPVQLWCDARNEREGQELTQFFQFKVPKRSTCARFLGTVRQNPQKVARARYITTPAGWMAFQLMKGTASSSSSSNPFTLGVGDASGMFPIDAQTQTYDATKIKLYNDLLQQEWSKHQDDPSSSSSVQPPPFGLFEQMLPSVRVAGQDAGWLSEHGFELLQLSSPLAAGYSSTVNRIPVAAAEGDQIATLAGSLIGKVGTVSCAFGTSVCANFMAPPLTDSFSSLGVLPAVDHYCAADGQPMHMALLRNGTTFLNTMVESYGSVLSMTTTATNNDDDEKKSTAFDVVMPALIAAPADCGGLLALPFMDDEPGLGIGSSSSNNNEQQQQHVSTALILGLQPHNATVGNVAHAALLSTMFNLKAGVEQFWQAMEKASNNKSNHTMMKEIMLSGGLVKTPECGQIVANVFDLPVTLLQAADEACSWGACVLAKYRHVCVGAAAESKPPMSWIDFLTHLQQQSSSSSSKTTTASSRSRSFTPNPQTVSTYQQMYQQYQQLVQMEPQLRTVMTARHNN